MNTYTKLKSGFWGIRVVGKTTAGEEVTVTKRNGEAKVEIVGRVLWSGEDKYGEGTISLVTIAKKKKHWAKKAREVEMAA